MVFVIQNFNKQKNDDEFTSHVIEMAWQDRIPFKAIKYQYDLSESQVIQLMRKNLKRSSFLMWRKRVNSSISKKSKI